MDHRSPACSSRPRTPRLERHGLDYGYTNDRGVPPVLEHEAAVTAVDVHQLTSPELGETGRGLMIVEAVSAAWGVSTDPTGSKSVWASVDVSGVPDRVRESAGARR